MADKKFVLPGPETVTISSYAADKLISNGDGDAALLYLYILKNRGSASTSEASEKLGRSRSEIESAMELFKIGWALSGATTWRRPPNRRMKSPSTRRMTLKTN